jgi:membrane peptidoglycan carboxypeptidase
VTTEFRRGSAPRDADQLQRGPVLVRTGTANDSADLATYGYLAPPKDPKAPALAVGLWMGNSDHSNPRSKKPAISLTAAAPLWRAFVRELTARMPIASFSRPKGVVQATIDAWTGGAPGPWTRDTVREWFISGTQPGARGAVDKPGLLYAQSCGGWRVDPVKAELGPASWDSSVAGWLARARRGVGIAGPYGAKTAYFWGRTGWGGPLAGQCAPKPKPSDHRGGGGKDKGGGGHGHGNGGGIIPGPTPGPTPEPTPVPNP